MQLGRLRREDFSVADMDVKVNHITSAEYPTKAVRPKNSRMSKDKLVKNGFARLPKWEDAVERYVNTLENECVV